MSVLGYLQKIGRALMVPVATLPAAAILLGIGNWIDHSAWGHGGVVAVFLFQAGSAIINHMSVLFAIGVAYGMSKDKDGAAALAGFIGFLIVTTLCSTSVVAQLEGIDVKDVSAAFGHIDNQFIGILVGVLSAALYNRYSNVELNKALSFFSGRRLVPIVTSFAMMVLSIVLIFVWPVIFSALVHFGSYIQSMGPVGAGLYGFFNRLLIPIGLHHALNSVFWFDVAGINDISNFLGGQRSIDAGVGIVGITGRYQAGFFPIMMFGLPGGALAIYRCAKTKNKNKVAGIMLAAAIAAFFTGVTEPLEFSFMFVAPPLYLIHAVLTGISLFIASSMHWMSGFGFSAGLVDLVLQATNPLATHWYMLVVQGIVFFFVYYFVFSFAIRKFNLMTPGREEDTENMAPSPVAENDKSGLARAFVSAAGGSDNITNIDSCITRLRLSVKDADLVNDSYAKQLGASGVIHLNKQSVQIIVGTRAELIAGEMKVQCAAGSIAAVQVQKVASEIPASPATKSADKPVASKAILTLMSPITGEVVALEDVPDEAFSSKAVGDGVAILPKGEIVVAPANGTVVKIFETNHAFCLETDEGVEIIVHIGVDTVKLEGKGFKRLIGEGCEVEMGDPILKMDLEFLNANAPSMLSPVIISNISDYTGLSECASGEVVAGESKLYTLQG